MNKGEKLWFLAGINDRGLRNLLRNQNMEAGDNKNITPGGSPDMANLSTSLKVAALCSNSGGPHFHPFWKEQWFTWLSIRLLQVNKTKLVQRSAN